MLIADSVPAVRLSLRFSHGAFAPQIKIQAILKIHVVPNPGGQQNEAYPGPYEDEGE